MPRVTRLTRVTWVTAAAGLLAALPLLLGAGTAPADGEVFSFADGDITEASGLAVVDGLFVTVNDSGDDARVFTVDPGTGETVGTTTWDADAVDVEALAPAADGTVWVGDIGDNQARRDTVSVTRVPVGRGELIGTGPTYELAYPDGPHDAETLLCDPATGQLLVATKGLLGGTLYAAPRRLDPDATNELTPLGPVLPLATDGTFTADGAHLVLRDYGRAVTYAWPSLEALDSTDLPRQEQGEAIAVDPAAGADAGTGAATAYVTSEGEGAAVLAVDLPVLAQQAAASAASSTPSAAASPTRAPTESREDRELPEATPTERSAWPWFLSGWIGVGFLVLLLRSMRRPDRR